DARLDGVVAVSGPSGAGKTTFLSALVGALPADATVHGRLTGIEADGGGWSPQSPRVVAATTREELRGYGADPDAALAELGLSRVAEAAVAELSPGELRRLSVARALARVDAGARLLVLDEATAHLDRDAAERVRGAILRRAGRATIVLASHDTATLELATSTIRIAGPAGRARTPAEAPPETPSPSVPAGAARDRGAGRGADAGPDGDAAGPRGSAA